jgi:hypothetical protein
MSSFLQHLEHDVHDSFVVCVQCFRVRQGAKWIDADQVIRAERTFDLPTVPHLESVLCADCSAEIAARRGTSYDAAAA